MAKLEGLGMADCQPGRQITPYPFKTLLEAVHAAAYSQSCPGTEYGLGNA